MARAGLLAAQHAAHLHSAAGLRTAALVRPVTGIHQASRYISQRLRQEHAATTYLAEAVRQAKSGGTQAIVAVADEVLQALKADELTDLELTEVLAELRRAKAPRTFWASACSSAACKVPDMEPSIAALVARHFALGLGCGARARHADAAPPAADEALLWERVSSRVAAQHSLVQLDELSRVADAFAYVRVRDPGYFEGVCGRLEHVAASLPTSGTPDTDCRPAVLAQLGSAYASAAVWLPSEHVRRLCSALGKVMQAHARVIAENSEQLADQYSPRRLTNIAAGLAAAQETHGAVDADVGEAFEALLAGIAQRSDMLQGFSGRGLALTCRCLALLGRQHGAMQRRLYDRASISAEGDRLRPVDLALLLNALAKGEEASAHREPSNSWHQRDKTAASLAGAMARQMKMGEVAPRDAANAIDAAARLHCRDEGLLAAMAEYLPAHIEQFGTRDVVGVAVAYGRLQARDDPVFITLATQLCEDLQRFSFQELVAIITAFARVKVREQNFQNASLEHCSTPAAWHAMSPGDGVSLLSAWSRLHAFAPGAYDAMSHRVLTGCAPESTGASTDSASCRGTISFSDLRQVALAYARVNWVDGRLAKAMTDACASGVCVDAPDALHATDEAYTGVGTILCALGRLRWQDGAFQQHALRMLLASDQRALANEAEGLKPVPFLHWAEALHAMALNDAAHLSSEDSSVWRRCCSHVADRLLQASIEAPFSTNDFQDLRGRWFFLEEVPMPMWSETHGPETLSAEPPRAMLSNNSITVKASSSYSRSLLLGCLCNALAMAGLDSHAGRQLASAIQMLLGDPPRLTSEAIVHIAHLWHNLLVKPLTNMPLPLAAALCEALEAHEAEHRPPHLPLAGAASRSLSEVLFVLDEMVFADADEAASASPAVLGPTWILPQASLFTGVLLPSPEIWANRASQ